MSGRLGRRARPQDDLPANILLGQPDFDASGENNWKVVTSETPCRPHGLCLHRGRLAIADSGNNRVTIRAVG